jgi:hypothetical protein
VSDARPSPIPRQIVVEIAKLRDYCLCPSHPHGRHKARVFRSRLGLAAADAETLRQALLRAVRSNPEDLVHRKTDQHGRQYVFDFQMSTAVRTAIYARSGLFRSGMMCYDLLLVMLSSTKSSFEKAMKPDIRLLDVVALTSDIPEKSLVRGQVGTVVEIFSDGQYEIEFADEEGRTYALEAVEGNHLLVLRYRPEHAA